MKKIFLIAACFLLSSHSGLFAQKYIGGAGGLDVGAQHFNMDGFNQFLPADFPTLSGDFLTIGGDGYFMFENFVIGGSGYGLIGDDIRFDGQRAQIGGGMGFFHLGYDFLHKDKLKLYPLIGIGGGGMTMVFSNLGAITANDVRNGNTTGDYYQTDISWGSLMIDLGLGFDYFPEGESGSSPRLGVRAGYIFTPSHSDFRYGGGVISGAEAGSLEGYYIRIIIGGGGFSKVSDE